MDYTIHNVSEELDAAIRERVAFERKTLNAVLLEVLARGFGVVKRVPAKSDLATIFDGTPLEPEVIQALEEQRQIEPDDWK